MRHILMIGATGYLGSHVASRLAKEGDKITAYVRSRTAAEKIELLGYAAHLGEIDRVSEIVADYDAVIFAPQLSHDVESVVVGRVLEAMAGRTQTFVFTSGTGVFAEKTHGEWSDNSFAEADEFVPSEFAAHRVRTEQRVRAASDGHLRTIVVRPPTVFGHGGGRHVPYVFNSVDATGAACYIGRGLNLYSNVHVDDLATLYQLALTSGQAGAVYHAVGGEADFRTIAAAVAGVRKCPVRSISLAEGEQIWGARPAQFMFNVCSRSRAVRSKAELGWRPGRTELIEDIKHGSYSAR
jgi:nucleoside-diphosphate-sugar epimerase